MPNQIGEKEENMAHSIRSKLKGMMTALVALVATLALVPTMAFAVEWTGSQTASITINNLSEGDTVSLYRVAHVQLNDDNTTTLVPETGVDQAEITAYLADQSETTAAAFDGEGVPVGGPIEATGSSLTFNDLQAGLYYVDVDGVEGYTYQQTVVALNAVPDTDGSGWTIDNVAVDLKKESDILDKTVTGGSIKVNGQDYAEVGDELTFTVKFAINATDTELTLTDTMSTGLVLSSIDQLVIKDAGGTVVPKTAYSVSANNGDPQLVVTFDEDWLAEKNENGTSAHAGAYTLEYKGTITKDATLDGVSNEVTSSNVTDRKSDVTVKFTGFDIVKYADSNNSGSYNAGDQLLDGAEFALYYDEDCTKPVYKKDGTTPVTLTTVDGKASTDADTLLEAGTTYYLKETKAPAGYTLPKDPFEITVTWNNETQQLDKTFALKNTPSTTSDGVNLPTTGGAGTVAFTAAGVVIIAGAAAFIVRSRKNNDNA
ncbi:SpaH/EbpB family LPXTG-anchored major pilin [Olsenella uli]|uniref:SpaH/EbpB family LPXTG-anchored major pilin n=1 Tax=Olsenella uli TaxID=133926 RepID=UPI00195946DE|nr:SpaH/EbpB family LPXTG-anchored major pilin [Olsenella uli]MBM6676273.1 SpaH/EbpB family LPXTG-anchored major pilin [Olsenella uli]